MSINPLLNLEASKLKANQAEITTEVLNLISGKETLYENEFSNSGGMITATIENKGKIEEVVIPSTIEVNDKLVFNKQDITSKLQGDNLEKILSSQGNYTTEQINLIKQVANSKEWHEKTTTLSGMGALIVVAVVTYFTAGAGTGVAAGLTSTATAAAIGTAVGAAVDAVIVQGSLQLANSAVSGKLDLDLEQIATSAVAAGILSYANSVLGTNALTDDMGATDYAKNATINGVGQGIQSEIRGDDFKDGFVTGSIVSLVSDTALQMRKYQKENYDYPGKPKYDANGELIPGSTDVPENVGSVGLNNDGVRTAGAFPEKAYTPTGELRPKPVEGPTGGYINGDRKIFGYLYPEDGAINYILESFGGVHDRVSSWNYENIDNVTYIKDNSFFTGTVISGALLIPSTPFAVGTIMQDNYQYIQDIRHFLQENKEIRKDAKDNK